MSPVGIVLYEIDASFGPNVLADFYLSQDNKITPDILKEFSENHTTKDFQDVTIRKDELKYYSSKIDAKSIEKDNLFLGFILNEEEDVVSLKSMLEKIALRLVKEFSKDRVKMGEILKTEMNSFFTLMEKLKEPALIKDTIDDKTKKLLDDGKLQEARELINLGEEIPEKLSEEIKLAEEFLSNKLYKKAKKSYLKAAELAETIQEVDIVSFFKHKAEQVGVFPDLIKEREIILRDILKVIDGLQSNQLHLYHELIRPVNRLINISSSFEEHELTESLTDLSIQLNKANNYAKELFSLDKKLKDLVEKL